MEKQKMEEKAMEENKKTNPDSERKQKLVSAILMAFVCILLMGGGTYAWFTMGNTARVNSLQLKVASEGNLYIATTADTASKDKQSEVDWLAENETKTLYPCTSADGVTMKKPVYATDTKVESAVAFADTEEGKKEKESYVLEKTFYLYLDDSASGKTDQKYDVCLGKNVDDAGTFFTTKSKAENSQLPEYCVRVSFTVGSETGILEPNSNVSNTSEAGVTRAVDGVETRDYKATIKQKNDGTFEVTSNDEGDSEKLFTIIGSKDTPVVVRVWFEGTDTDCCNTIDLNTITAQLKFVANKTTD